MGILDDPRVSPVASQIFDSISAAEARTKIQLTPFAREIVALLMVALPFEGPDATKTQLDAAGVEVTGLLSERLPRFMDQARDAFGIADRSDQRRNVMTSADVYHWLVERAPVELAGLPFPYEKD